MKNNLIAGHVRFEGVKGVGTMDINFAPDKNAYVLIGENGIGKTKFLESLFVTLFISHNAVIKKNPFIEKKNLPFSNVEINEHNFQPETKFIVNKEELGDFTTHSLPIVYLSASNRNNIKIIDAACFFKLGNQQDRFDNHLEYLLTYLLDGSKRLAHCDTNVSLNEWIVQRAQSANKYQSKEDNREVEITTLLTLLNKIDERIDAEFLEIAGNGRVFIQVEGQKRELSELSSGFTAILKILQAIIAGYSYFTNEVHIQQVRGMVLIDEIESHLHNEWQVNIVPLLKTLFPNTTFVITTHSSLVISQLAQGEAYRLTRHDDGVVYGELIENPNKIPFVDLIHNAFGVDLNQVKINRTKAADQTQAKQALLALVERELAQLETE
ncbi:MAG: cytochrome C nitrite reductase [Gammaproteobacteria bacterium]|nr:MAG: cytochrome C nitrite reductase [Gammaproteobacteria bacterium]